MVSAHRNFYDIILERKSDAAVRADLWLATTDSQVSRLVIAPHSDTL